ncbi:MAG: stage II sporulation protein D [Eubacteriales bacterium]
MPHKNPKGNPYGYSLCLGLISALSLFLLSAFFSSQNPLSPKEDDYFLSDTGTEREPDSTESSPILVPSFHQSPSPIDGADQSIDITLLRQTGEVETLSLDAYLWGVVAAEMPATFPLEALKAQTVAARSYTGLRLANPKHSNAVVCDDSACCQAYIDVSERLRLWGTDAPFYQEHLREAISQTNGLYVLYEDQPIDALFFSSSSGQTLEAQEVWGTAVPYLQSVPSPEDPDIPNYHSQVVYTESELALLLQENYPQIKLGSDPNTWVSAILADSAGGVAQMTLGGITLTGSQLRSLFSLRSTYFTLDYENNNFTFSVTGYGHGVGMSQYGAKALADQGYAFDQILTWYYAHCSVDSIG